jgi:transketolase
MHTNITSLAIRQIILRQAFRAHRGHIGSGLCVADILAALYGSVLRIDGPRDAERDRFVLSKGHAALALYAALHLRGWLSQDELDGYCTDGSRLGVHPEHVLPGVDFSTGSLGMGLSYGAGAALAARLEGSSRRVFVLLSDGECNEGSVWETALFAAHHNLSGLTAIVDWNGQQALGQAKDVLEPSSLAGRWRAFGWNVHEVDGHDVAGLAALMKGFDSTAGRPHAVLARTVFGKGVDFMERQIKWHYWPMNEEEFAAAMAEVTACAQTAAPTITACAPTATRTGEAGA